jgi:hypothetical protein
MTMAENDNGMTRQALAATIRARYLAGETHIRVFVQEYGIPWTTANAWARGERIPGRAQRRHGHPVEVVRKVKQLLKEGNKREWIALECGISVSAVTSYALGITRKDVAA